MVLNFPQFGYFNQFFKAQKGVTNRGLTVYVTQPIILYLLYNIKNKRSKIKNDEIHINFCCDFIGARYQIV